MFVRLRWEHACSLDALTISIVLKHQGASFRALNFGKCTGNWRKADLARLKIENLTTLGIGELETAGGGPWATELLARNYQKLRHLRLGSDKCLATDYAEDGLLDTDESKRFQQTKEFAELMKVKVTALNEPSTPLLRLESLSLIGLDLSAFAKAFFEPVIDFKSLSVLKLESCAYLKTALPLLMGTGSGRPKAKSALRLHTLSIRHENTSNEISRELETFLISLKPLAHLHLLLEGDYEEIIDLHRVLQVHGKCLRSLVWDERTCPRSEVRADYTLLPDHQDDHLNLKVVAKHCPGLKALGMSLAWGDILKSEKCHKKVNTAAVLGCTLVFLLTLHRLLLHFLDWISFRL